MLLLWRMHQEHELVVKKIMRREISSSLRKICGQGHLLSLLCKQEIASMYHRLKCPLEDQELGTNIKEVEYLNGWVEQSAVQMLAPYLQERYKAMIKEYLGLVELVKYDEEVMVILLDHLHVIRRLLTRMSPVMAPVYLTVPGKKAAFRPATSRVC